jgi:predicted acyltransferase
MTFVMPKLEQAGPAVFWKKVLKRTALIFLIGLFLNWWPFLRASDYSFKAFENVRIFGVLQRIALAYFFAAIIIYYLKSTKAFYAAMLLLLGYWALCLIGNPADPYSLQGWFGTNIDKAILGITHMYKGEGMPFDPEGIMSTIPAIAQVVLGFLVGNFIKERGATKDSLPTMLNGLFVAAIAMLITGFCWDMVMPINKKIWTSSYVVYTTGLATLTIATMIYFIEINELKIKLSRFFDVFGKNALFVFALSAFLPKGLALIKLGEGLTPWNWLYKKVYIHIPGAPENGSLAYALTVISFMWLICWWLDKKKIYIKV